MRLATIFLGFCLLFTSCASIQQRQTEEISQGVYATKQAMNVGRFDIAKQYNDELTRIVPPPKHPRKEIKPLKKAATANSPEDIYAVLPPLPLGVTPIVKGSDTFNQIINGNKILDRDEKNYQKDLQDYGKDNDSLLRDKERELNKPHGFFSKFRWLFRFGIWGTIIGVIVILIFFPALFPFVISIFERIAGIIGWVLRLLTNKIKSST